MRLDINYYRAKYDFDVASKIAPPQAGATIHEEYQDAFRRNATLEVLQKASDILCCGTKSY